MKDHQNKENLAHNGGTSIREFFTAPVLKPLAISLGLMLFQDFSGVNAVVFYTVNIFQAAGSTIDGYYATIIVGAVQLVFTIASGLFVSTLEDLERLSTAAVDCMVAKFTGRSLWT